jgi:hypothetical protein
MEDKGIRAQGIEPRLAAAGSETLKVSSYAPYTRSHFPALFLPFLFLIESFSAASWQSKKFTTVRPVWGPGESNPVLLLLQSIPAF